MQIPWKKIRHILMLVMCGLGILGIILSYVFKDEKLDWWLFSTFYFPLEPMLLFCIWAEDRFTPEEDEGDVRKNGQSYRK